MARMPCDEGTPTPRQRRPKWTRPSARAKARASEEPWVVRASADFLDHRLNPIKHTHRMMLLVLESLSRTDSFNFHDSQEIAGRYGCTRRHLQVLLREMDDAGLIVRVFAESSDDPDRIGIILRKRSDPTMPVALTEADVAAAVQQLRSRRSLGNPTQLLDTSPGALKTAPIYKDTETKTNTTTTEAEVVVVLSGSQDGGKPTSQPPPLPEVDPAIAAAIAAEFPAENQRAEVTRAAAGWSSAHPADRVRAAIRETGAISRSEIVHNPVALAGKILANWNVDGKVSVRKSRASPPAPRSKEQAKADQEAENRKRSERKQRESKLLADVEAEKAAGKARLNGLSDADRAALLDHVKREYPAFARWDTGMLEPFCIGALDTWRGPPGNEMPRTGPTLRSDPARGVVTNSH